MQGESKNVRSPSSHLHLRLNRIRDRVTKGISQTQPVEWKDAAEALDNEELAGCYMPAGPGKDINSDSACLQYNEVSRAVSVSRAFDDSH
jgi:hypothetical protein